MQSTYSDKYVHPCNIEILNLSNPQLQLINTKTMIKKKLHKLLHKLLCELRKCKIQAILVVDYKKKK